VIVVVGGSARKVGKTTVVCEIVAATKQAQWFAVKISPHAHEPSAFGDTERYLAAGAARALLTTELPPLEGNVILESTSAMDILKPDLFVYVLGAGSGKPSALKHVGKADFTVNGHVTEDVLRRVKELLKRDSM